MHGNYDGWDDEQFDIMFNKFENDEVDEQQEQFKNKMKEDMDQEELRKFKEAQEEDEPGLNKEEFMKMLRYIVEM